MDSPKRFVGLSMPTGSGKTLVGCGIASLFPRMTRKAYLTSTRPLQDQISKEFSTVFDMRGQSNYPCVIEPPATVEEASCHSGYPCDLKFSGCIYFDRYRKAQHAPFVLTNYAFWYASSRYSKGLGGFKLLILDEAHDIPGQLAESMTSTFSDKDLAWIGVPWLNSSNLDDYRGWLINLAGTLLERITDVKARMAHLAGMVPSTLAVEAKKLRRMEGNSSMLAAIMATEGMKVVVTHPERKNYRALRFEPVWPAKMAETFLFQGADKVIFMSATMRPKTIELLGVTRQEYDFFESKSNFPVKRRPIYKVPVAHFNYASTEYDLYKLVRKVDDIIAARPGRRILIHTVSYDRQKLIYGNSKFRARMAQHDRGEGNLAVEAFKRSKPDSVLVSPAMTTGVDLPYDLCRVVIIVKVPFIDRREPVIKARLQEDREYTYYSTVLEIVQSVGRGMRAADDFCETFILDANFADLMQKWNKFAAPWFIEAIQRVEEIPPDPAKPKPGGGGWIY